MGPKNPILIIKAPVACLPQNPQSVYKNSVYLALLGPSVPFGPCCSKVQLVFIWCGCGGLGSSLSFWGLEPRV